MAYVSRSPPIIPDGQISRVRFETLAFRREPSQDWRGLNAGPYTPPPLWFAPDLASRPVVALRRFYQAGRHTAKQAAMCPEPLCPTSVLPPLGRCVCHLLRGRYPSVIAPTGSCATPVGLSPASAFSLVRRTATGHAFWRIAMLLRYRLAASRLNWFAACFGVPSHCLPLGSGRSIVGGQTSTPEGARTGFVQALCKTSPMSLWVLAV